MATGDDEDIAREVRRDEGTRKVLETKSAALIQLVNELRQLGMSRADILRFLDNNVAGWKEST
jgi:hypothetical protein